MRIHMLWIWLMLTNQLFFFFFLNSSISYVKVQFPLHMVLHWCVASKLYEAIFIALLFLVYEHLSVRILWHLVVALVFSLLAHKLSFKSTTLSLVHYPLIYCISIVNWGVLHIHNGVHNYKWHKIQALIQISRLHIDNRIIGIGHQYVQ